MFKRIGYVAISLRIDASTNKTCRLSNATPENLRSLIESNINGLEKIISYNIDNNILLYRISSQIIPFASHPVNDIKWWEEFSEKLKFIGKIIKSSNMRVSMHPPQFVNINSPVETVVKSSIADLLWHARFLDTLGIDSKNKIIIHGGGVYGNKEEAIGRFVNQFEKLPDKIKERLVIENDERNYTVEDCLEINSQTGIPVVFDYLHHQINPGTFEDYLEALKVSMNTWGKKDGIPKIHFSSQARGKRTGSHSETIYIDEFLDFYEKTKDLEFDIMLEVKDKDISVFKVRDALRN